MGELINLPPLSYFHPRWGIRDIIGVTSDTMDEGQDISSAIFPAPETGNITAVLWRAGTLSGTYTLGIGLQGVDGSGNHNGSWLGGASNYATRLSSAIAANTVYEETLPSPVAVNAGQTIAVTKIFSAYTSGSLQISKGSVIGQFTVYPCMTNYNGGSPVISKDNAYVIAGVKYNNYIWFPGSLPNAALSGYPSSSGGKRGNQFTVPVTIRACGIWVHQSGIAAGSSFDLRIEDTANNVLAGYFATNGVYYDSDMRPSGGQGYFFLPFSPVILYPGTTYRMLVYQPGANALSLYWVAAPAAVGSDFNCLPNRNNLQYCDYNGTAWTVTSGTELAMGLLYNQIEPSIRDTIG